ncbi:SCO family protein [Lederbergia lenta]|uniref:SCO family protein n=1 Tax=Lederbergia lenta TaxID=1467 RepID=UPI00203BE299|nr:SCO family protein [Lederbergia lenta]MCM3111736.1 SCO family protein [Lederbergia lenta]
MKKYITLLFIFVISVALVYWFWPNSKGLPVLEKVKAFQLDDVHGSVYHSDNNKIKLLTFYYTNCPDICPLTMIDFSDLQAELKSEDLFGNKVELVAITFDPKQDTSEVIRNYAGAFQSDPLGWKWLRGTETETKTVADQLKLQYVETEDGIYTHSTTMYLIDVNNKVRALYQMSNSNNPIEKEKILEDIRLLADSL